jgi:uncharacterized protein
MFREMRRTKQLLSKEETIQILQTNTSGVLAVTGDNGYPYTVPLSYVYKDNKLFFHCANEGHKIDSIKRSDKVTFCVIDRDDVVPDKFLTLYRSVIVFGRARILTVDNERQSALESITEKYSSDFMDEGLKEIVRDWNRVCVVEIEIEHMTGKVAKDLVNDKL